jgi:hypothetical protein
MGIRKKTRNQWKARRKIEIAARRKKKAKRLKKSAK